MKHKNLIAISALVFFLSLMIGYMVYLQLENGADHKELAVEFIQFDKKIPYCETRQLNNKILLITSRYCPHCKEASNLVLPMIKQYNLSSYFTMLDIINFSDLRVLNAFKISTPYIPVLIIDCHAYVGVRKEREYKNLINKFNLMIHQSSD